jgi:hypothetical protein
VIQLTDGNSQQAQGTNSVIFEAFGGLVNINGTLLIDTILVASDIYGFAFDLDS